MKTLVEFLQALWSEEEGLETVEYAVVGALIITAAVTGAYGAVATAVAGVLNAIAGILVAV